MKFVAERKIENRVLSVNIKFDSFGEGDLTDEQEKALITAFGAPVISVGGEFKGTFDKNGQANAEGQEVSFVRTNKELKLNEKFQVSYELSLDRAKALIKEGDAIQDEVTLAVAHCNLFEQEIEARAVIAADELQARSTSFVEGYPREFFA